METRICKVCGDEYPISDFKFTRSGSRGDTCISCITAKIRETKAAKRAQMGGGKLPPFSDPDFDGCEPREVIDLMSRAKKWLEARGYEITLKGTYTQIREVKF